MKNRHLAGLVVFCLLVFSVPVRPQTQATSLALGAHWDDNSALAGNVTIAAVHVIGADTVLATKTLSAGWASVSLPLASNSMYHVTLTSPTGVQLVKFPITTALINPQNIERGTVTLVLRKADSSLKFANLQVSMNF
jgi:hypothetical protein